MFQIHSTWRVHRIFHFAWTSASQAECDSHSCLHWPPTTDRPVPQLLFLEEVWKTCHAYMISLHLLLHLQFAFRSCLMETSIPLKPKVIDESMAVLYYKVCMRKSPGLLNHRHGQLLEWVCFQRGKQKIAHSLLIDCF